jgi:hypothetical protein
LVTRSPSCRSKFRDVLRVQEAKLVPARFHSERQPTIGAVVIEGTFVELERCVDLLAWVPAAKT